MESLKEAVLEFKSRNVPQKTFNTEAMMNTTINLDNFDIVEETLQTRLDDESIMQQIPSGFNLLHTGKDQLDSSVLQGEKNRPVVEVCQTTNESKNLF